MSQGTVPPRFDVVGIGNAIVDIIARTDEDVLVQEALAKGTMTLIDVTRAEALYARMGPAIEMSGGSAANTVVGIAALGGHAAFFGKVRDDVLGEIFAHDLRAMGIAFGVTPATQGPATGRCYILVTPDGERTMNTYLGASRDLAPEDVDAAIVGQSAVTYLEGYLWDPEPAKRAFLRAAGLAHEAGRQVALTLSDPFCVDRYRGEFLELLRSGTVDLVFANQHELRALYQTADLAAALDAMREDCALAVVTLGPDGAMAVRPGGITRVPATPVAHVIDTTGAGDLFAAGFLFGLARGLPDRACLELGAMAAGEIIQHVGARPQANLKSLAAERALLPIPAEP